MKNIEFSTIEKEMASFDFEQIKTEMQTSKNVLVSPNATTADIKEKICTIWGKIRRFIILLENIPVAGKFVQILVELLDSICNSKN
ncbi:MAG: hypothetical protein JSS96_03445 [Bacteroidetes bacterium]|nr:hypothetical protein [Bacteroidota bacterium]